jgi:hypothetical protein
MIRKLKRLINILKKLKFRIKKEKRREKLIIKKDYRTCV